MRRTMVQLLFCAAALNGCSKFHAHRSDASVADATTEAGRLASADLGDLAPAVDLARLVDVPSAMVDVAHDSGGAEALPLDVRMRQDLPHPADIPLATPDAIAPGEVRRDSSGVHELDASVDSRHCEPEICDGLDNDCDGLIDATNVGGQSVSACACFATQFALMYNAPSLGPDAGVGEIRCLPASDGEAVFSYRLPGSQWALCELQQSEDLSAFDNDRGGLGALEVRFCVTPVGAPARDGGVAHMPSGTVNLWYGQHPWRRRLLLTKSSDELSGCATRYFAPKDACFAHWTDELGQCAGRCVSEPCDSNKLDARSSRILIAVEGDESVDRALEVRIISIRYLPPGCLCQQSKDCTNAARSLCNVGQLASSQMLPAPGCVAEQRCSGVCVDERWTPCRDTVGRSAEGIMRSTAAFQDAYRYLQPRIGCPGCPSGCAPYVHPVAGVQLQDFFQPDQDQALSPDGQTALAYDPEHDQAVLLKGVFWGTYKCLSTDSSAMDGPALLGAPVAEAYQDGPVWRQPFAYGTMVWTPPSTAVAERIDVYLSRAAPEATALSTCGLPPVTVHQP